MACQPCWCSTTRCWIEIRLDNIRRDNPGHPINYTVTALQTAQSMAQALHTTEPCSIWQLWPPRENAFIFLQKWS
jgi:hypothetical protein